MKANHFSSQASATRGKSTFLFKPLYEGQTFNCYESSFNSSCDSVRVHNMENLRLNVDECLGIADGTCSNRNNLLPLVAEKNPALSQQFEDALGKQPVFYLQERFCPNRKGFEWNGFLLFSVRDSKNARNVILAHQDELHVVLAYDDPDKDIYFFLIDTETGGGTMDEFYRWQADIRDLALTPFFHNPQAHMLGYYSRALTSRHYDIVNHDVLFGHPIEESERIADGANTQSPRHSSTDSLFKKFLTTIGLFK